MKSNKERDHKDNPEPDSLDFEAAMKNIVMKNGDDVLKAIPEENRSGKPQKSKEK